MRLLLLSMVDASDVMKLERIGGGHFRSLYGIVVAWWVTHPVMPFTVEQITTFQVASETALECILIRLSNQLYDVYLKLGDFPRDAAGFEYFSPKNLLQHAFLRNIVVSF
jgi:hypothetical protein